MMGPEVSLRDAFGEALVKLGEKNQDVVVLDADVAHPTRIHLFAKRFPERFFEIGVAEQNMMGVAAGFATCGFIPFPTTFGVFASKRAHDQVSISIAYPKLNVKIVGAYSGLTTPNTGATHQAIDDIASMRAMPNMTVVVPADAIEIERAVFAIAEDYEGPVYLRVARCEVPTIFDEEYRFKLGCAVTLRKGQDVSLIGTGIMTAKCLEAADLLRKEGVEAGVLHIHTLKPIDEVAIIEVAEITRALVTAENHSVIGGLGSAVSEVVSGKRPCLVERVGIQDVFGESGKLEDLFRKYGLTTEQIVKAAKRVLERKDLAST